jgi:hypothetical protein
LAGPATNQTISAVYDRLAAAPDLQFRWLESTNLLQWAAAAGIVETALPNANPQLQTITNAWGPAPGPMKFFRLGVELKESTPP